MKDLKEIVRELVELKASGKGCKKFCKLYRKAADVYSIYYGTDLAHSLVGVDRMMQELEGKPKFVEVV